MLDSTIPRIFVLAAPLRATVGLLCTALREKDFDIRSFSTVKFPKITLNCSSGIGISSVKMRGTRVELCVAQIKRI